MLCKLTWLVAMGLLDTSGGWRGFTSGLGGELLTRSLSSGGFTYVDASVMLLW